MIGAGFRRAVRWLAGGVLGLAAAAAWAHQLPVGLGAVTLRGNQAVVEITVALSALRGVSSDGPLDPKDLQVHRALIEARIASAFELTAPGPLGAPVAGRWREIQLALPGPALGASAAPAKPVVPGVQVTALVDFPAEPAFLTIRNGLWPVGDADPLLRLTVVRQQGRAVAEADVVLLSPRQPQAQALMPWNHRLAQAIAMGFEHIMGGPDHLLFLATLLVAQVALRRWLVLLTSFTIAHGVTFSLAALGWVDVPAQIVEPAIAASIVAVALSQLSGRALRMRLEALLVFSLGLIHGLGFASAMRLDGGLEDVLANSPILAIVGFNLGVEAGQVVVALFAYVLIGALRRVLGQAREPAWQKACLALAAGVGSYWIVERMVL